MNIDGTPDKNLESYANQSDFRVPNAPRTIDGGVRDPETGKLIYNDALKFSNCERFSAYGLQIIGGSEDAVDLNRGSKGVLENLSITPSGNFGITIKGGFDMLIIRDVEFEGPAKEVEIDIGNYSDQAPFKWNTDIILRNVTISKAAKEAGMTKIRVRVLWGSLPDLADGYMVSCPDIQVLDQRILGIFFIPSRYIWGKIKGLFKK